MNGLPNFLARLWFCAVKIRSARRRPKSEFPDRETIMDFEFDPRDDAFRQEVRAFVRDNLPADIARRGLTNYHTDKADTRAWTAILHGRGWSAPSWPVQFGGTGWTLMQQFIFDQECFAAGAPLLETGGLKMIGPVIYTFGSKEQHERFNVPFLRGEISWGQGFSEPNAGSDLAGLTTAAVRDGDHYVVNGRKLWTSGAQWANWLFCLVKTDPKERQRGISMILIKADAPGVTIRPIIDLGEGHHLNEMFFDNVRVPAENLVGEEGKGWTYAKFLLENERAFSAEVPRNKRNLALLRRIAADRKYRGRPFAEDPAFAARIEQLQSDLDSLEWMTLRALTAKSSGDLSLPVGSILKVRGTELQQKIGEMQVEALGDYGAIVYPHDKHVNGADDALGPDYAPGVLADFLYRRAVTIYGGSNEIQRTILAKQYLGL
ncbi:acyl-CoA dehydrogenase [Sphingobium wenxiniae]|nr:acyl-CoA dehydrogenase [Sphingobium wenxiniae]